MLGRAAVCDAFSWTCVDAESVNRYQNGPWAEAVDKNSMFDPRHVASAFDRMDVSTFHYVGIRRLMDIGI